MKKRVTSGWVLSFSSEEALLQAVRTLVKEEGVFWEVCAPYPCAAVRFANRHAGRAVGAGVRLWAAAGGVCGFLAVALWLYWTQFCADQFISRNMISGPIFFHGCRKRHVRNGCQAPHKLARSLGRYDGSLPYIDDVLQSP